MYVKPTHDHVPDIERGGYLAAEGREVEPDLYWLRRLQDGDVQETAAPPEPEPTKPAPFPEPERAKEPEPIQHQAAKAEPAPFPVLDQVLPAPGAIEPASVSEQPIRTQES